MFDRLTQKARRVLFSARSQATSSQIYTGSIEPVHILLGMLTEDVLLISSSGRDAESVRQAISELPSEAASERLSLTGDMPLSAASAAVFLAAAAEADALRDPFIGTFHVLVGLRREAPVLMDKVLPFTHGDIERLRQRRESFDEGLGPSMLPPEQW
jgi:ATP-dependent Clp protease ATP-binding subunit ClpA